MIEVTFLGTGSGIPSLKRNHAAIVLEHSTNEREAILFDCGEGTQKQFMKEDFYYSLACRSFRRTDSFDPIYELGR